MSSPAYNLRYDPNDCGGNRRYGRPRNLDALIKREDFLAPEGPDVALSRHQKYQRLVKDKPVPSIQNKRFSNEAKQVKLLEDVLKTAFVCNICGARIDKKSMQLDHVIDKSKGGAADIDNSQWTHPFCNSTFKYAAK